jgi:hypothetical protein
MYKENSQRKEIISTYVQQIFCEPIAQMMKAGIFKIILYPEFRALLALHLCQRLHRLQRNIPGVCCVASRVSVPKREKQGRDMYMLSLLLKYDI